MYPTYNGLLKYTLSYYCLLHISKQIFLNLKTPKSQKKLKKANETRCKSINYYTSTKVHFNKKQLIALPFSLT